MISPSFPAPKKISEIFPQRCKEMYHQWSVVLMYRGARKKTSSQIGVYGFYWVFFANLVGGLKTTILKNDGVKVNGVGMTSHI